MANTKTVLVLAIVCFVFVHELGMVVGQEKIDCPSKCQFRCSKSWKQKMCLKTCNTCCQKCNCVPPGVYGNKETCPCYNDMKTHGGKSKCP